MVPAIGYRYAFRWGVLYQVRTDEEVRQFIRDSQDSIKQTPTRTRREWQQI